MNSTYNISVRLFSVRKLQINNLGNNTALKCLFRATFCYWPDSDNNSRLHISLANIREDLTQI